MKITISVKSELALGNVCYQEFSSLKQVRSGKIIFHCRSSHLKTNKNHLKKNLLLSWSDKTACSTFHFSMSSYQNSSGASLFFYGPCSKQTTGDIFIHTHKMVLWNSSLWDISGSKKITFIQKVFSQIHGWKIHEELFNTVTLPLTQEILEMWIAEG